MALRVGLTGGIATGKSRVSRRFEAAGVPVLDLDRVGHAVLAPGGEAHGDVVAAFGPAVVAADGTIDRRALGALVFGDDAARARLNALVHPRIRAAEQAWVRAEEAKGVAVVVVDAALLVEVGMHLRFDRLVVVHCPPPEQVRRLVARDGLAPQAAAARVASQMPVDAKRRHAHLTIDTDGPLARTDELADAALETLRALPATPPPDRARTARRTARMRGMLNPEAAVDALWLAGAMATDGGLDLPSLVRRRRPRDARPWWDPVRVLDELGAILPLAAWAVRRRGFDEDVVAAAGQSLAPLAGANGGQAASLVLAALAAADAITVDASAGPPRSRGGWAERAEARVGAAPEPGTLQALEPLLSAARRDDAPPTTEAAEEVFERLLALD